MLLLVTERPVPPLSEVAKTSMSPGPSRVLPRDRELLELAEHRERERGRGAGPFTLDLMCSTQRPAQRLNRRAHRRPGLRRHAEQLLVEKVVGFGEQIGGQGAESGAAQ